MLLNSDLPIQEILDSVNVSNSTYFYQKSKKKIVRQPNIVIIIKKFVPRMMQI